MVRRLAVVLGSAALLLPLAAPVGQRSGVAARYLLAMAATATATAVQAQTVTTLVTNKDTSGDIEISSDFHAQTFHTGDHAAGYTLTSVEIRLGALLFAMNPNMSVKIREVSGVLPTNTVVATLTNPGSFQGGRYNTFTAPANTVLQPNRNYAVSIHEGVINNIFQSSSRILISSRSDNSETGLAGWDIADGKYTRDSEAGGIRDNWEFDGDSVLMTINGYANNSPASGAPAIIGTARVGQLLAASTGGIMDTDGLTGATFQYQWVRDDGDNETNIAGATSLAYRVTPEDEGATLKVKVSFTDDSGFDEEVTSDPTATIAAATTSDSTAPVVRYWVPTHLYVGNEIRLHSSTDVDIASYAALGLPAGLTINATNGQISGRATMVSTAPATVVVTVTDASDNVTNIQLIFPPVEATDTTAPRVVSIERQNPDTSPTNADSLTWRVIFSEQVDFQLAIHQVGDFYGSVFTVSGSTATVTSVEAVSGHTGPGSCMVCDVTVTGGDLAGLDGTVMLGFASGHVIEQRAFPPLPLTNTTPIEADESYVVDNTAPSVSYTVPTALAVDTAITPITPTTTDPDASGHSYSATGLPPGLGIDASTGVISGSPTTVGTASDVVVVVMDSAGNSATITLAFPAVVTNAAPTVANAIADQTITVGTALNFAFPSTTFTDADGDTLTYSATLDDGTPLPSWLMFDATNRSFSGIPGAGDGGAITVRVTASDGAATGHDDFKIRVGTTCPAPSLGSRRQLWSGTVTVGEETLFGRTSHGYDGYAAGTLADDIGALNDTDFDIGVNRYTIDGVEVSRAPATLGDLIFTLQSSNLTAGELAALKLHVCDTTYNFSTATHNSNTHTYTWEPTFNLQTSTLNDNDWSGESTRTLYLSLPANNAATGLPTITSSAAATVGDVLTANQGDMADSDGLPTTTFPEGYTVQWVREDENGSNQQPIPGQNAQTYTLSNDDVGKKVRVQVSFTDRLSGMETVTSAAFPASGTVTPPLVTVTGPSSAVEEGSGLTFTVTLNKAASTDLSVNVAISETGDVVAAADEGSQTVSIAAGDTQATLTVATDDDDDDEANSEVTVAVVADSASPVTYGAGSPSEATVMVEDNDLPRLRLDGPLQATYDEGETVRFGLTREGDLSSQLVVPVTVSGGEAMIAATPPSNVTFGVGSDTATLSISTEDDDVDEDNSEISVTVSANAADYRLVDTTDNPVDEQMANATIQDNDTRGVTVSGSPLTVNEGGTGAYEVVLNSAPTGDVTITLSPPDNEDVSVSPTTLTFTAFNWNMRQPVSVTTTEDTDDVDDTATITHTVTGADYGDNNVTAESVMVTVSEMVLPTVTIATGASPVTEGTAAAFTLTRDDTTNALTVNLTVTQNGAVLSTPAPSSGSVTFDAGFSTAPFSVATDDDNVDEGEGTVTVEVAPDSAAPATYVLGTPATATVTVEDNDASPVVTLLLSENMIAEADGVSEVRATLSNPSAEDTQVTVSIPAEVTGAVLLGGDPVLLIPAGATTSGNAVTLTAVDNPVEAPEDLQVTVSGMAGNTLGVTQPESVTLTILDDDDTTAPTVTITNVPPTSSAPFTATIAFNEVVSGFMVEEVMVSSNAELSDFTEATTEEATPGTVWTVLVTPTADGDVTLNVAANVATDAAGNGNTAATEVTSTYSAPHIVSIERQAPTTSPTNADRLTWRVTFSEAVMNVDAADFTLSGTTATISVAPVTGQPAAWEVTVSGGDLADLNSTVRLELASGQTIVGGGGGALATTLPTGTNDNFYEVDNTAPRVRYPVPPSLMLGIPLTLTPTTEDTDIASFGATDLPDGLEIDELTGVISGTPTTVSTVEAVVMVTVSDQAGTSATQTLAFPMVAAAHQPGVVVSPASLSLNEGATASYTVTLNTRPTGAVTITPTSDDINAVNVSPARLVFTTTNWDTPQTVTVAAMEDDNTDDQTVTIAHAVSGADYDSVTAASMQVTVNDNDTTDPTTPTESEPTTPTESEPTTPLVAIRNVPATSAAPFTATITFNEMVSGFTVADIMVSNATLSDFTEATTGEATPDTVWTVLVTPEMDGPVTLDIAADVAMNAAGNGNTAATQARSTYTAPDMMAPTVGIDVPATSHAPFTATITFNEMVSGFTVADIMVSNATLSDFTEATTGEATPDTVWTVLVTPEMDGPVTLDIAADVAMDAAGNGNTAATQARSTYTAPAMETEAKEEAEAVLKEVVLPEVMQQLTAETTEVITSRLNSIASGSPGAPLTLSLDEVVADTVAFFHGEQEHLKNGSLEWGQVLSGRDFVLPLSGLNLAQGEEGVSSQDNPFSTLALWGGGNYSSYRNIIENTDIDGNGFFGTIGMDLQPIPRLTAGLAITTSRWGLDYATNTNTTSEEGTYKIGVTMLNPYMNWLATEQLSFWATVGYGRGEVEQDPEGQDALPPRTDGLTSWAGGVRFEVVPAMDPLTGEGSPFGLAIKVDGATSSFLDTQVQLARLAAEVSHAFATEGGLLSAALELGWRIGSVSGNDDPDDQQQAVADQNSSGGAELAGHLNWRHTDGSVSATVDTRVLLDGGHHKEWGIGGHLRLTPSRRDGEGLSLTLQPSFGVTGTRLEELWSLSGDGDLAINNDRPNARLDAELAYGFRPLGNALFTPYTELTWEETANAYGAGLRYHLNPSLELDLKGAHHRRANGNTEHRFSLDVRSNL